MFNRILREQLFQCPQTELRYCWPSMEFLGALFKVVIMFRRSRRWLDRVSKHQTVPQPRQEHSRVHGALILDKTGCKWRISFLSKLTDLIKTPKPINSQVPIVTSKCRPIVFDSLSWSIRTILRRKRHADMFESRLAGATYCRISSLRS